MSERNPEIQALKESISAHFAALVGAMEKQSPGITDDFDTELVKYQFQLRDLEGCDVDNTLTKESLGWTLNLIRGR